MARSKRSNSKKSTISSAEYEKQITEKKKTVDALNSDLAKLNAEIKERQAAAKAKKAEIRKAEKVLATLVVKQEESEAIEKAAAQKAEIEKVVTKLISSGKSAEDILERLKQSYDTIDAL